MEKLKRILKKIMEFRFVSNLPVGLGVIIFASFVLCWALFFIQSGSFMAVRECIRESGYRIFLLNWMPILFFMLIGYFLFNNLTEACGITGIVLLILSIFNRNMIQMRQAPFKAYDILLGGEFLGVAKSVDRRIFILLFVGLFAFFVFFALCMFFIRNKKMKPIVRIICSVVLVVCVYVGNKTVYSDKGLYEGLYMLGNFYNEADNFASKGFLYSFIYSFNTNRISKPVNYDRKEITERIKEFEQQDHLLTSKPNIILILSEAFSEIPMSEHLNFDGYQDPLFYYKGIKERSTAGNIIVPNVGGGTSDTEFDIFTGISTRQFRGTPYTHNLVTKPFLALPSFLKQIGYKNLAIHPGYTWFYNRKNVYPYFGFDRFIGLEEFDPKATKGMYISEDVTFDRLIEEYESFVKSSDEPFFEFLLTIQNHGPYKDKYGAEVNFASDLPWGEDEINALSNYFEGMTDCDRELNRLIEYVDGRTEPIVIIYYGDHLPSFLPVVYDELIPEDNMQGETRLYSSPFFIYQNAAAKEDTPLEVRQKEITDWNISSNYLGAMTMELLGFDGVDPFFDFVNQLRKKYPVILEDRYFDEEHNLHKLDPGENHDINLYKNWSYYKIFE